VDPKLLYWTGALLNMVLVVVLAVSGVASVRRGDVARHRRRMLAASVLVGAFVLSYALKVAVLGREPIATWSPAAIWTLRVHELCVLVMLVGGAGAGLGAFRMRAAPLAAEHAGVRAAHRRAGRAAVIAAGAGLVTAGVVLAGMYGRAG